MNDNNGDRNSNDYKGQPLSAQFSAGRDDDYNDADDNNNDRDSKERSKKGRDSNDNKDTTSICSILRWSCSSASFLVMLSRSLVIVQ